MKKLINPEHLPLVAVDFMNKVHYEDVDIINELYNRVLTFQENQSTDTSGIDEQYSLWFDHTVAHFKGEEDAMLAINFPPYPMHKSAHDEKLKVMKQIQTAWLEERNIGALRGYLEVDLVNWITNHIQAMDHITAIFLQRSNP